MANFARCFECRGRWYCPSMKGWFSYYFRHGEPAPIHLTGIGGGKRKGRLAEGSASQVIDRWRSRRLDSLVDYRAVQIAISTLLRRFQLLADEPDELFRWDLFDHLVGSRIHDFKKDLV